MTPEKVETNVEVKTPEKIETSNDQKLDTSLPASSPPPADAAQSSATSSAPGLTESTALNKSNSSQLDQPTFSFGTSIPEFDFHLSNEHLVRRHSLSLRDIPAGSIADEILKSTHFNRAKSLLSDIKQMRYTISDFGSCQSFSSSSDDSGNYVVEENGNNDDDDDDGFKTMNRMKRSYKKN